MPTCRDGRFHPTQAEADACTCHLKGKNFDDLSTLSRVQARQQAGGDPAQRRGRRPPRRANPRPAPVRPPIRRPLLEVRIPVPHVIDDIDDDNEPLGFPLPPSPSDSSSSTSRSRTPSDTPSISADGDELDEDDLPIEDRPWFQDPLTRLSLFVAAVVFMLTVLYVVWRFVVNPAAY